MKKISLLYLFLLFSGFLFAQKQINDLNAQVRPVKIFHAIKIANGIELLLTQSNSEAIAVSADEVEHRNRIITEVSKQIGIQLINPINFKKYLYIDVLDQFVIAHLVQHLTRFKLTKLGSL